MVKNITPTDVAKQIGKLAEKSSGPADFTLGLRDLYNGYKADGNNFDDNFWREAWGVAAGTPAALIPNPFLAFAVGNFALQPAGEWAFNWHNRDWKEHFDAYFKAHADPGNPVSTPDPVTTNLIDFEDIAAGQVPDGYKGFNWDVTPTDSSGVYTNLYARHESTATYDMPGYKSGSIEPGVITVHNPYISNTVNISKTSVMTFIFDQVYATQAYNTSTSFNNASLDVVFKGYNNGVLVGEQIAALGHTIPTLVDVSWAAIDRLQITALEEAPYAIPSYMVFDNFRMG